MNREARRDLARVAARPPARTVDVTIATGDYKGWAMTARADFPAGMLVDLQSGDVARIIGVLDVIVVNHNMPNAAGELAASMSEVDPYGGLMALGGALFDEIGRLPPR